MASYGGHLDVVWALLEKGADVNARRNEDGVTPLIAASAQGHVDVVRALLEKGADVDVCDCAFNRNLPSASPT